MTVNKKSSLTAIFATFMALCSTEGFAAGAREPGLPQLDITTWPSQLFWLVIVFSTGYLVMAKIVIPKIGAVLEERRKGLDSGLG